MSTPTQGSQLQSKVPRCQPHPACPAVGPLALTQQGWMTWSRLRRVASLRLPPEVVAPMGAAGRAPSAPLSLKGAALRWTPCHLPELGLAARLQTAAWLGLSCEGGVWGTGEGASAPRPGHRHCGLSHRLVAAVLGAASLHPSLPPLGEEETEAQGANGFPTVTHTGRGVHVPSQARLPATPLASPCAHSDGTARDAPPCGPWAASPQALRGELGSWLLFPVQHGATLEKLHRAGLFVETAAVRDEQTPHPPRVPREPPHRLGRGHSLICDPAWIPCSARTPHVWCVWGVRCVCDCV